MFALMFSRMTFSRFLFQQTDMRPDAWCSACEQARVDAGGDWTPEVEEKLRVQLLCGACYDYAKTIWSNGRKITQ
jgi:hypothetical protein